MTITIRPGTRIGPGTSVRLPVAPNGLTAERASTSAWQIKRDYPNSTNGLYWIKNDNINAGNPVQIYADMTTAGGGWTLLVQSTGYSPEPWTNETVLQRNTSSPPVALEDYDSLAGGMDSTKNYSILGWADYIKKTASGGQTTFDYMLDAGYRTRNGGIWTANENYSFVATYTPGVSPAFGTQQLGGVGFRKNITEIAKFDAGAPGDIATWNYASNTVEARMPYVGRTGAGGYLPGGNAMLTTDSDGAWWGTIISLGSWIPAPWMETLATGTTGMNIQNPRVIWYWVR
jgi:hypothetical protein